MLGLDHKQLAIDGGAPVRRGSIPPWPVFARDEIDAVVAVLESGQVNQWTGSFVVEFQDRFAARTTVNVGRSDSAATC